jgi:TrmH family RNA methyltransferase
MPKVTAITSRGNPLLVRMRRLVAQPDAYRKQGQVWVEGEHLCRASLAPGPAGQVVHALITETAWGMPALRALASRAEAVAVLSDALMAGLSTLETPSPLAFAIKWPGAGVVRPGSPSVVLDRLQDAGNVGTILRTAAAFGCTQVVALKGTAALWSPKVMRAAMGAHFALGLVDGADEAALDALAVPLLATSSHAAAPLPEAILPWPCAWVLGNEGQGIAEAVMRRCTQTLRIPQPGGEESLNVAVAAAICLYESARPGRR